MNRGVVLIAVGHPNYGRMAAALASTLRLSNDDIKITLLYSNEAISELREDELSLFDLQLLDKETYKEGRYLRPKLLLYDLSPYDETIYLDVDMAWLGGSINDLFYECVDSDFNMKNYGYTNINKSIDDVKDWAMASHVAIAYSLSDEKNFHLSSECLYFKKTKDVKKLFSLALKIFDKPKVESREFAGYVADELAFNIAMMKLKLYPSIENWQPIFWRQSNKALCTIQNLKENFKALSMGGVRATDTEQFIYNTLVSSAYYKLGILYPYKWINKYRFLRERKII